METVANVGLTFSRLIGERLLQKQQKTPVLVLIITIIIKKIE